MSPTTDSFPTIICVNGIPDHKMIGNLLIGLIVSPLKRSQCAIRKNNAPAIRHIRRIAFNDGNLVCGMSLLNQEATIETGRPGTQNNDSHCSSCPENVGVPLVATLSSFLLPASSFLAISLPLPNPCSTSASCS